MYYTKIQRKNNDKWLLLLHCICYDGSIFKNIIPKLVRKYNLILIDLPGHGKSNNYSSEFTIEQVTCDIHNILIKEKIDKVTLFGISLGSLVATKFLENYSNFVEKAIFVSAPYSLKNNTLNKLFKIFTKIINMFPRKIYLKIFINEILKNKEEYIDIKKEMYKKALKMNKKVLKNWLCIMSKYLNYDLEKLKNTGVKKIYIMGENDKTFVKGIKNILSKVKCFEEFEYIELKNTGHLPHIENEKEFLKFMF